MDRTWRVWCLLLNARPKKVRYKVICCTREPQCDIDGVQTPTLIKNVEKFFDARKSGVWVGGYCKLLCQGITYSVMQMFLIGSQGSVPNTQTQTWFLYPFQPKKLCLYCKIVMYRKIKLNYLTRLALQVRSISSWKVMEHCLQLDNHWNLHKIHWDNPKDSNFHIFIFKKRKSLCLINLLIMT